MLLPKSIENLYLDQAYYVEKYLSTSESLERQGFYKKVADFLKRGDIMIDVGCGDCRLIHYLKKMNQSATIIGIDINPLMLMIGNGVLTKLGHKVNLHCGANIAMDPNTNKLTLISDILTENIPFKFEKGEINLLQEDFRFGEVLIERLEKDLGLADVIIYSLPGGFSPHIMLEKGKKNYNSIQAGLEMNQYIMALGVGLLKDKGRMIWAMRAGAQNPETLKNMDLDGLNLSEFKPFYDVNRIEIVYVDEQKLKLNLPAYSIDKKTIHYTDDIRKIKHDLKIVVILIEMIKKRGIS